MVSLEEDDDAMEHKFAPTKGEQETLSETNVESDPLSVNEDASSSSSSSFIFILLMRR